MTDKKKFDGPKLKYPKVVVILGPGTLAYSHINKPDTEGQYADGKYKGTLVLDGDYDLAQLHDGCMEVAKEAFGAKLKKIAQPKMPDIDGDTKVDKEGNPKEEFAGKRLITAKSKKKPLTIDAKKQPLPSDIWPSFGDVVKMKVTLVPYTTGGQMGVTCRLEAVQLIEKNAGGDSAANADGFDEEDGYTAPAAAEGGSGGDSDGDADF